MGSQGASPVASIAPSLFEEVEPALDGTAATTPTLDPVHRSEGALDDGTAFLDPGRPPAAPDRPHVDGIQPAPPLVAVAKPTPAPTRAAVVAITRTPTRGSWHRDPDVSWYGPGFYGNRTACGYALTKTLLGVAHRTLPCGTKVTFRNPANGRTITVKVVDRGPYVAGRQWDMTGGLCVALDHCYTGPMDWRFA